MVVDITNEILTKIKLLLPNANVLTSYPDNPTVTDFPFIIVEETDNSDHIGTRDSAGFHHSNIAFRIEIYTKGSRKMSEAKILRGQINSILSDELGLARGTPMVVPNFLDNTVYKYVLNYFGRIDKDKIIYRG